MSYLKFEYELIYGYSMTLTDPLLANNQPVNDIQRR
jgi:hypothetical protein